ncbi:hypothetical protein ACQUWY_26300, partial [Ralstonia pseudosolanacearum]
ASTILAQKLSQITGVGQVNIGGASPLAVQRWSPVLGGPGAVAGTLLVLTGGLSLWPLLGALVHGRRARLSRAHP